MGLTTPLIDDDGLPILDDDGNPLLVQRTRSPATHQILTRMWPTLIAHHGVPVFYDREGAGVQLEVVKGRRGIQLAATDYTTSFVVDEWFCLASVMKANGFNEARQGDRIQWYNPGGELITTEVHLTGPSRQWDYVDPEGTIVQIFTAQVHA